MVLPHTIPLVQELYIDCFYKPDISPKSKEIIPTVLRSSTPHLLQTNWVQFRPNKQL